MLLAMRIYYHFQQFLSYIVTKVLFVEGGENHCPAKSHWQTIT